MRAGVTKVIPTPPPREYLGTRMKEAKKPANDHRVRPSTFSPYIKMGVLSVEDLEHLAARMRSAGAAKVKIGGEMVFVWDEGTRPAEPHLGGLEKTDFKAQAVRPVRICSAETFCQRFHRPVLALARRLDERFRGTPLPMKLHIGVAGCPRSCSEPAVKDIGIIGHKKGYQVLAGGTAGLNPMLGQYLGIAPTEDAVMEIVERILRYLQKTGKKSRLGRQMARTGLDRFMAEAGIKELFIQGADDDPNDNAVDDD